MAEEKQLWEYALGEIAAGFAEEAGAYRCVFCGKSFEKGRVFELVPGTLYDACGAVRQHVAAQHGTAAEYLLAQKAGLTGVTELQQQILRLMCAGKNDREIAQSIGVAASTVRNHRFKLREKEKQALLFLALMRSLEERTRSGIGMTEQGRLDEVHAAASMVDARYEVTEAERDKTIKTYFDEAGALKQFPARAKKKLVVLKEIARRFKPDTVYSEKEVNRALGRIFDDYATIRRALIEYGFMERRADGSEYRLTLMGSGEEGAQ